MENEVKVKAIKNFSCNKVTKSKGQYLSQEEIDNIGEDHFNDLRNNDLIIVESEGGYGSTGGSCSPTSTLHTCAIESPKTQSRSCSLTPVFIFYMGNETPEMKRELLLSTIIVS